MLIIIPLLESHPYVLNLPVDLDFTMEGIPDSYKLAGHILFCMLCEDMTFHCSHRLLHSKALYPYVHKLHHEYKATFSLATYYAHPVEFILGNIVPLALPVLILGKRMHFMT